jgi:hypothetical protein
MYVHRKYDLYTPTSIYAYPRFHLTHFAPTCQNIKISFKQIFYVEKVYTTIHNHFYMNIKYIEGSMMLTKEAFEQYIQQSRNAEATQYGLTTEEYQHAIMSGSVVQAKSLPDL